MLTLYTLVDLLPLPVYLSYAMVYKIDTMLSISFSVYPVPVIAQVFLPVRHLPKYWYYHPTEWRRIIFHLLVVSKRCSFTPPLAAYETACVTWCLRSLQTFVKAREKALDMLRGLLLNSKKVLGRAWEVTQPKFLKGWISRQAGMGWYDRRGWAAGAVSQLCFPEKVQHSTAPLNPNPWSSHFARLATSIFKTPRKMVSFCWFAFFSLTLRTNISYEVWYRLVLLKIVCLASLFVHDHFPYRCIKVFAMLKANTSFSFPSNIFVTNLLSPILFYVGYFQCGFK